MADLEKHQPITHTDCTETMKANTFRMPDEVADWLRDKAAMETIRTKKMVSANNIANDIFQKAMEAERRSEG